MAEKSKIILLSGLQPTGPLHLGNYLGAVRNFVRLQDEFAGRFFVFVADYHSLTENYDPKEKQNQILMLGAELLAAGLDPKKVTLYVQSDIPEVTELCWVFNTVTPISFLERMTQFKDKASRQKENINMGLFDYPVLQAADILLPKAAAVPVGEDQVQHVELTRDIARFFNRKFGETFPESKPVLTATPRVMSLSEPEKKMSKSIPGSFISLSDSPEEIKQALRRAVTDTGPGPGRSDLPRRSDLQAMSPGVANLFGLLREFGTPEDVGAMERAYRGGTIKYVELKDLLAARIAEYFSEFRKKRAQLLKNPSAVKKIFAAGGKKIRAIASKTMREVRQKVGLR
ncbi:tryptophan--tRNA ligase [Patescibacteria group bacterium]|nr:MAG: tryptophan--tRNA ligase [Patescibacteria group bacterium]